MSYEMMEFFVELKSDFWWQPVVQLSRTIDVAPTFLIRKSR